MHFLRRFWIHPWTTAVCNVLLVMCIYTLTRLFFYIAFPHLFAGIHTSHLFEMMLGGLRFDLTAILYLSLGYLFLVLLPLPEIVRNSLAYSIVEKLFFFIPNALGIIINCIDMPYILLLGRRMTATVYRELTHDNSFASTVFHGMGNYWFVTVFCVLMLVLLWKYYRRPMLPIAPNRKIYYWVETAFLFISAFFIVIGIRGGLSAKSRPLTISDAMLYVERTNETS